MSVRSAAAAARTAAAERTAHRVPLGVRIRPPVLLFTAGYVLFPAMLWLPLAQPFPETFVALTVDRSRFGYKPPVATIMIYLLGLYAVWLGYLYAKAVPARAVVRRVGDEDEQRARRLWRIGVAAALAAFVVQILLLDTVPLVAVSSRWELSPKLVQLVLWLSLPQSDPLTATVTATAPRS